MKKIKRITKFQNVRFKIRCFIYRIEEKTWRFLSRFLPLCQGFDSPCWHFGKKRRQNTQYVDDERNFVFMCDKCAKINSEHWQEMWNDYWRSVL